MINIKTNLNITTCMITTVSCIIFVIIYVNNRPESTLQYQNNFNAKGDQKYREVTKKKKEFINPMIRSAASFKTVSEYICKSDQEKVKLFKTASFERRSNKDLESIFYQLISNPVGGRCANLQRFGGHYMDGCHYWDGHKFVCMPDLINEIENNECLVYSFGVSNDWSFEKAMGDMGCKVLSFDPTVDHPNKLADNVWFEKLGLGTQKDEELSLDSFSSILHKNRHENSSISYLKIDIEGEEVNGLQHWFNSGALDNVQQIGMEYHLVNLRSTVNFFKAIQQLYLKSDFRLISFDINGCYGKKHKDFPRLAEIVLMRSSEFSFCDDS